ncbi:ciliary microtubule inner protein 4 isoform X2 [Petaurus breviceps papuanus]|uniref:ciliary microtubule inner protein 4 isoform X2 n=1 Tax=Petaurus breviceps papuanus TaxID=3040969 RepID=UPI0036DF2264
MGEKVLEPMKDLDLELQDAERGEAGHTTGVAHGSRPLTNSQRLPQKDNGHQSWKGSKTSLESSPKSQSPSPPRPSPTREISVKSSSRLGTTHSEEPRLSIGSSDGRDIPSRGALTPRKHGSRGSSQASRMSSREDLHLSKAAEDCRVPKAKGDNSSGTGCQPAMVSRSVSCIPSNIRHKFGSNTVDQLVTEEQARRAIYEVIEGQKQVSSHANKIRNSMESSPFADYYELGYNMRSNIFQGPPMEAKSLMKDSYTADVIERAVRDPQHWHGRKTDDLGRWHRKNALDLNLQKALDQKIIERRKSLK